MFISIESLYSTMTYPSNLETVLHITVLCVKALWLPVFVDLPYHFPLSFDLASTGSLMSLQRSSKQISSSRGPWAAKGHDIPCPADMADEPRYVVGTQSAKCPLKF